MADVTEAVQKGLQVLANLPDEVHWLCEKAEPSPNGRITVPDEDLAVRYSSTLHAIMLLSFSDQEANQAWLKARIADQLERCPQCVEAFYSLKRELYQTLLPEHGAENLEMFFTYLDDWDIERIQPVVVEAVDELGRSTSPNAWYQQLRKTPRQSNAIYECFCHPGVLRSPEIKSSIKRISTVEKMTIQGPAACLVTFLFDEDPALRRMAEKSWEARESSITTSVFQKNLSVPLEEATRRAEVEMNPKNLDRFFKGVSTIVQHVPREVIVNCISGAERDPIKLASRRFQANVPFWSALLRLFRTLMSKLQRDVWEAISPLTPSGFIDFIFTDHTFNKLLRETEQGPNGEAELLDLTEWMSEYVNSIGPLLRPTAAPTLISQAFRTDLPGLSRGLCLKEGMKVLSMTLKAVESEVITGNNTIVRGANDTFMGHRQSVIDVAFSEQIFEDKLMEKHMLIAQRAAQEAVISALKLDVLFLVADFTCLSKKKAPTAPVYQQDIRIELWDIVSTRFPLNDSAFCIQILQTVKNLTELDQVYISPKDTAMNEEKKGFNTRLSSLDQPLAGVLKSMSRCSPSALDTVLSDQKSVEMLLTLMMSRSEDVAMSAEEVLINGLRAEDRIDALRLMLVKDFSIVILSLQSISRVLAKGGLFAMMPRWVEIGMNVMDLLCDKTEGIIRRSDMEQWERSILRVFWDVQWRCLGTIFKRSRRWALSEDKEAMIKFLRNSMDYAETLFDNFWTYEQALSAGIEEKGSEETWSARLLQDASKALNPFTSILSIQDEHLLQTCQKLMCKMLTLLAENKVSVADEGFFLNLKRYLYPETFPEYDAARTTPTNLTDVQKTELSVTAERLSPGFIPVKEEKQVIELSDDEYGAFEIPDEEMIKAADGATKKLQSRLDFQPAPRWSEPKPAVPKTSAVPRVVGGPLRGKPVTDEAAKKAFLEKRKAEKAAREKKKEDALRALKPKSTAVVESSDDDSSSDEGRNALFKLGSRTKVEVKDAKVVGAAARKQLTRKIPVTKRVKDIRARVAPDMTGLWKQIFSWDFFHDDAFPPGLSSRDYTHVAKAFSTFGAYQKTFEPLLLLEAWQSFLKSKEELMPSACLEVKLKTRMRADAFVELQITVDNMPDRNRWFESDVVLLSSSKDPLKATQEPHCIARVFTVNRKFNGPCQITLRCDPGPIMLQNHMRNDGTLYGIKIMNLTPLEREYQSLICMQYYDLREEILTAKPSPLTEASEEQIAKTRDVYSCNEPQAKAIISAVSSTGFSLIQGPPGTGKTKTVIGIVGALLTPSKDAVQVPGAPPLKKPTSVKKVLVCAPSNAAVDELIIRFKQGLKTKTGDSWTPTIVRLGRSDAINADVKDVTLEELISARLQPTVNNTNGINGEDLRGQHTKALAERGAKLQQMDDARAKKVEPPAGLQFEIDKLNTTIRELRRQLDQQRDQKRESGRNAEILRQRCQQQIMNEAQIICATLSGAGHEMLRNVNVDFETVIIDEAAQSVELSALIPLKFGCEKCILVGDPQQLPPTVLSRNAAKFSYEKSLFVRMQENYPENVHLLSIQYRMHPDISAFPSREFYNSGLQNGEDMAKLRVAPWHDSTVFGPYRFFNVAGSEARQKTSLHNPEEARMALALFGRITEDFPNVNFDGRIGIVTPYRQQLGELKRLFQSRYGEKILTGVEFNTVDAFQGRERDIIIFSCVRAAEEGGVGFLSDIRRMNVGLTRAKSSLFILGNSNFLVRNVMWKRLVEDSQQRGLFTQNVRGLFDRPTRTSNRGMNSRPAPTPPMIQQPPPPTSNGAQQVEASWDPMDIDEEVPVTNQPRQNPQQGQQGIQGARPNQNHAQQRPPPQRAQENNQFERPQGNNRENNPREANITCHSCGQKGHRQANCPGVRHVDDADPQIPELIDPSKPQPQRSGKKRTLDSDDGNIAPHKRVHTDQPPSAPTPDGSNTDAGNSGSSLPPRPPPKGVIKRKSAPSDMFIRKKPKRGGGGGGRKPA